MKWSYGVTTVPERSDTYLPATLESLRTAGFDQPRLFIDGNDAPTWREFGLNVTCRSPRIKAFGSWMLGLMELFIREPAADRYAMFQDDLLAYRNLRNYLESVGYPDKGYCNLYTFPKGRDKFPRLGQTARRRTGWWQSNQRGWGALALVFNRDAVLTLLSHRHMVERPMSAKRGDRNIDGGVVTAMVKAGWKEYIHNPSLVQHTGTKSSIGTNPSPQAECFRGADFDATELLKEEGC